MKRRNFLHTIAAVPVITTVNSRFPPVQSTGSGNFGNINRLKLSLNAYSFNKPLMDGSTHSPLIIAIESYFNLFGRACRPLLKPLLHFFVLLIEDYNDLPRFGSEERIETMLEYGLSSPGEGQLIHLHSFRLSRSEKNGGNHYSLSFFLRL